MLSKIKAANNLLEARTILNARSTSNIGDQEEGEDEETMSNCEVKSSGNNDESSEMLSTNDNNNNHNNQTNNKKSQDELLDIVEASRKRRLSQDSADSLTNFIRWSFSHLDPSVQRMLAEGQKYRESLAKESGSLGSHEEEEEILDETDDWASLARHQQQLRSYQTISEQLLRQQLKLASNDRGNLTQLKNQLSSPSSMIPDGRPEKRARTRQFPTSFENEFAQNSARKNPNYLGSVVERLHLQQQQQQQQRNRQQRILEHPELSNQNGLNGLSSQLQQFLQQEQQQNSVENLCTTNGLEDTNQLALATAIHRALVDSLQNGSKSSASSTGSNSEGGCQTSQQPTSANNFHHLSTSMADSTRPQRRVYNTRASNALNTDRGDFNGALNQFHQRLLASANSNRVQQQRHAQAAAALSALAASADSRRPLHPSATNLSLSASHHPGAFGQQAPGLNIDFRCDICPSSFDDRHRLMQHQSIHLELKKEWFTETPVDEVMKIFNRRRGEFLCNICNLRFEATLDYDQHNHERHGPRPYCCQFCGNGTRTFKCWRQYLNHLYDHRYIFSCTIDNCDFTVNRRDSLRFHIFRFHLNCQLPQQIEQQQQAQRLKSAASQNRPNTSNRLISQTNQGVDVERDGTEDDRVLSDAEDIEMDPKWARLNVDESLGKEEKDDNEEDDDETSEGEMNVAD